MLTKLIRSLFVAATVAFVLALAGCGQVVEQNQLALVLHSFGNRDAQTVNKTDENKDQVVGSYSSELVTAKRAPVQTPGTTVLLFPLGLQAYMFEAEKTAESPDNEEIVCDSTGGKITFDVAVHVYIDPTYPDIKERLVKLMQDYRLIQYSGTNDVLKELIHGRFRNVLRTPFVDYCAGKSALEVMTHRSEINTLAAAYMNKMFNPLGLRFPLVAIASAVRVPPDQQAKMNAIFEREVDNQVLRLQNDQVMPLNTDISNLQQSAITESEQIANQARADTIALVSKAQQHRKEAFIKLIGADRYLQFETMYNMVRTLESGQTKITVVPDGSQIFFPAGAPALPPVNPVTQTK